MSLRWELRSRSEYTCSGSTSSVVAELEWEYCDCDCDCDCDWAWAFFLETLAAALGAGGTFALLPSLSPAPVRSCCCC